MRIVDSVLKKRKRQNDNCIEGSKRHIRPNNCNKNNRCKQRTSKYDKSVTKRSSGQT